MFYLQTGVHLQEVEIVIPVEQEFDRAGTDVASRFGGLKGDLPHLGTQLVVNSRRWRLFNELLVASLDRAFALAEVNDIAVRVGQHLHLDMTCSIY